MWLVAEVLQMYCLEDLEDWFTGQTVTGNHALLTESSEHNSSSGCRVGIILDKCFLMFGAIWLLSWSAWLMLKMRSAQNRGVHLKMYRKMDPSTEWGLKHFHQKELSNRKIDCTYDGNERLVIDEAHRGTRSNLRFATMTSFGNSLKRMVSLRQLDPKTLESLENGALKDDGHSQQRIPLGEDDASSTSRTLFHWNSP